MTRHRLTPPTARAPHVPAHRAPLAAVAGLSLRTKLVGSAAVLATAAGAAGLGTFGTFTSTTSASENVSSGTIVLALGADGTIDNRLSLPITGLVPGDTAQRALKLVNTGTQNMASISLTTTAGTPSLLTTDPSGLTMKIDRCSVPWTESGVSPAFTYTCSGTASSVLAQQAAVDTNLALNGLSAVNAGSSDYLRVTVGLPLLADNTLQGLSSTIGFAFTGVQRTATNR